MGPVIPYTVTELYKVAGNIMIMMTRRRAMDGSVTFKLGRTTCNAQLLEHHALIDTTETQMSP